MRVVAIVLPELALEVTRVALLPELALAPGSTPSLAQGPALKLAPSPKARERERERELERECPRAVVLASRSDMDDSSLTGNVRLHAVCPRARHEGIFPGQTIAAARARAASLSVQLVTEEALLRALERIAEASLAFGATVAFARGTAGDDTVWVDVTGCAHLFVDSVQNALESTARPEGSHGERVERAERAERERAGEARLLARLEATVRALGHTCRLALAGGTKVARALALASVLRDVGTTSLVVPPGGDREALAALPLEGLPLEASTCQTLRRLGLRTARELMTLPRAALGARLGSEAAVLLPLLDGDDRTPLTPYIPKKAPSETIELEYGTDSLEALGFVAKTLTSRLASRLEGRGIGVTKLSLVLELDARAVPEDTTSSDADAPRKRPNTKMRPCQEGPRPKRMRRTLTVTLPTPVVNPKELFVVLRTRLERTLLPAPVLALTLRADEHAPRPEVPQSLFEPESREARALPLLVAELTAELGEQAVGRLSLGDSWLPEERSCLVPFFSKVRLDDRARARDTGPSTSSQASPEPSVLLPEPMPVDRRLVSPFRFVARYESLAWWRGASGPHDVVAATVDGRTAIVDLDKTVGIAKVVGWLD